MMAIIASHNNSSASCDDRLNEDLPDVRRKCLAKVDVAEAVGQLEGTAESEVALSSRNLGASCGCCYRTRWKHSAAV